MSKKTKAPAAPSDPALKEVAAQAALIIEREDERDALKAELKDTVANLKDQFGERVEALEAQIREGLEEVEDWTLAHPEAFGDKRSLVTNNIRIGYRTAGKPTIGHALGKDDDLLEHLQKNEILQARYVKWRIEPKVDKEAMISDVQFTQAGLPDEVKDAVRRAFKAAQDGVYLLNRLGVTAEKGETFFVERADK